MSVSAKIKTKYGDRLSELIQQGEALPITQKSRVTGGNYLTGEKHYQHYKVVNWPEFVEWRTSCTTVLEQVVPKNSAHRKVVEQFSLLKNEPDKLQFGVSFLKSIKGDLELGFLDNLALQIEEELTVDYLEQAESILSGGGIGQTTHVAAAVLAGAILEKALKTICSSLEPAEPTVNEKGAPLGMNVLIDTLKKRQCYNEIQAKQLRAWADIRNSAAHGNFDDFTKPQVEQMVSGVRTFVTNYLHGFLN